MLKSIFNLLKSIGEGITSMLDFVISFFEDVAYVIKLTAAFVAKIPDYFGWLPSSLLVLVVSMFAIVVVYKVLGRE